MKRNGLSLLATLIVGLFVVPFTASLSKAEYVNLETGVTIHYEQSGNGSIPIVFIPGWTMSTDVFVHQLSHFEGSDKFRAIAYDPRGQGRSSKTMEGHTYQQHGRDLAAFIDKLELENVILAGWSYGVQEQFSYINQFGTDKLAGVISIDSGPDVTGATYDEWVWYLNDDSNGYARWFTEGILESTQSVIDEFAKWMLEDASPENIRWVSRIANMTPPSTASLLNATGYYLDYSEDAKKLDGKLPLLFVTRDDWRSAAEPWISANTPSAQSEFLGKHLMFWERHDEFNKILDNYLAQF